MRIDSSAPTRIDLAGGTIDIWPLYLFHPGAQTLNAATTLRAHCSLRARDDRRLVVVSEDSAVTATVDDPEELLSHPALALIARILMFFGAEGLEIVTRSDSPVGAGIAGSSALNIALCAALARWKALTLTNDELMQIAMNVEAQAIDVPTGVQDYRPAVYGGVSAIELRVDGVQRRALPVDIDTLDAHVIVAYTGASRNSGINNWEVFKRHIDGDGAVRNVFDGICDVSAAMRLALEAGQWTEVGVQIAREWSLRKQLAPGVTTPLIDQLVDAALTEGAIAAKICGAGGGGCLLCFVPPDRRAAVQAALASNGATILDCRLDREGLRVVEHPS